MALSAKRAASRFRAILSGITGIEIPESEQMNALFQSIFEEIKNNMETLPFEGTGESESTGGEEGGGEESSSSITVTSQIPKGKFR
jgi:hypothetical protein